VALCLPEEVEHRIRFSGCYYRLLKLLDKLNHKLIGQKLSFKKYSVESSAKVLNMDNKCIEYYFCRRLNIGDNISYMKVCDAKYPVVFYKNYYG